MVNGSEYFKHNGRWYVRKMEITNRVLYWLYWQLLHLSMLFFRHSTLTIESEAPEVSDSCFGIIEVGEEGWEEE